MRQPAYLFLIACLLCFSSCVPFKESAILQDVKQGEVFKTKEFRYDLSEGDQLHIEIKTWDEKLNKLLSTGSQGGGQQMNIGGASLLSPIFYLQSYSVNSVGEINLPFFGYVKVSGMTLEEATRKIQEVIDEKMNKTTVNVKMVSYKIAVHGEVTSQGIVTVFSNKANIFEVTGLAGGITEFGNRKQVQVIRSTDQGNVVYSLDLTSKSVFSSEGYYLLPNDIVVINPLKAKNQRLNLPLLNVVLSSVSTLIGVYILSTR